MNVFAVHLLFWFARLWMSRLGCFWNHSTWSSKSNNWVLSTCFFVIFKGDIHHKPSYIRSWLKHQGTKTTTVPCEMKLNSSILLLYVFWGWKKGVYFYSIKCFIFCCYPSWFLICWIDQFLQPSLSLKSVVRNSTSLILMRRASGAFRKCWSSMEMITEKDDWSLPSIPQTGLWPIFHQQDDALSKGVTSWDELHGFWLVNVIFLVDVPLLRLVWSIFHRLPEKGGWRGRGTGNLVG